MRESKLRWCCPSRILLSWKTEKSFLALRSRNQHYSVPKKLLLAEPLEAGISFLNSTFSPTTCLTLYSRLILPFDSLLVVLQRAFVSEAASPVLLGVCWPSIPNVESSCAEPTLSLSLSPIPPAHRHASRKFVQFHLSLLYLKQFSWSVILDRIYEFFPQLFHIIISSVCDPSSHFFKPLSM